MRYFFKLCINLIILSHRAGVVNYSKALSGFDPDQRFSATQLLAHSLPAGWGEEKWEGESWWIETKFHEKGGGKKKNEKKPTP